ncbi:unnamed protein product, partial [Dibothriocephalus latus]
MQMASECPLPVNTNLTTGAVADFKMIGTVERNPDEKHQQKMFHPGLEVPFGQLGGRENFPQLPMDNPFERAQGESSGNLLSGYNFLANQIYRSVSNPLYKLVRTVENAGGEGGQSGNSKQLAEEDRGFPSYLQSANGAPHNYKFYNTVSAMEASLKPQSTGLNIGACMKFEPSGTSDGSSTARGNAANDMTSTGPCSNFNALRCCDEYPEGEVPQNPTGRLHTSSASAAAPVAQPPRRQNLNIWELPTVHQWYPAAHQRPGQQRAHESAAACHSADPYNGINWSNSTSSGMQKALPNPFASISLGLNNPNNNNNNISTSKQSAVYNTKSETPSPVQSPVSGKPFTPADVLSSSAGHIAQRYPHQYFQDWADANSLRDCVYYPSFENTAGMPAAGSNIPSPRAEE